MYFPCSQAQLAKVTQYTSSLKQLASCLVLGCWALLEMEHKVPCG